MEENGRMGIQRSWVFPNEPLKENRVLQLISAVADCEASLMKSEREPTTSAAGSSHHTDNTRLEYPLSHTAPVEFSREAWLQQRALQAKLLQTMSDNSNYSGKDLENVTQDSSAVGILQIDHSDTTKRSETPGAVKETVNGGEMEIASKNLPKAKKPRTKVTLVKDPNRPAEVKSGKKNSGAIPDGITLDLACVPVPVCSCTGVPQQCYKWGSAGWQSACCTTMLSMYPLPMSPKKPGVRIPGRKMSLGFFKKVLEKLLSEGHNLADPVDLRTHWAKHGTNRFVTIR